MKKQILEKLRGTSLRTRTAVVIGCSAIATTAFPMAAYAAEGDMDVAAVVGMVQSVMTLLTTPPLSYFLTGGLALMAFKVFRGGKKAAN